MYKSIAWMPILLMLLSGCQTAPSVPPSAQVMCPRLPPLIQEPAALEPSFTERMQNFLAGKLPEQSESSPTSPSAKPPTVGPGKH